MTIKAIIEQQLAENSVVLYMKGTPDFPQCGFSGKVTMILRELGVKPFAVNVLEDPEIRQGIKDFSDWPTVPQLYINGEFIGGCDIVTEMYENDELKKVLQQQGLI